MEPITIRGPYLWQGNNRFLVRGIVYQYHNGPVRDPIADDCLEQLEHDIVLFKELGVNTIYVYRIDNSKSHSQAIQMLEEAGIYVLACVTTNGNSLNRMRPNESYTAKLMSGFFKTVDELAKYPNVLGINAADNVVNHDDNESSVSVIAAAVRDLKRYMRLKNKASAQRILPVGYGAATVGERDRRILQFLASEKVGIDFWPFKTYQWSNDPSKNESLVQELFERYQDVGIPIFFSEYNSSEHRPRQFLQTISLYSPKMMEVFSGGCVYEYEQEANNWGLVKIFPDRRDEIGLAGRHESHDLKLEHYTRETTLGTLYVFKEFDNYKARLAETKDVVPNAEWESVASQSNQSQPSQQWTIPESCVDWAAIEGGLATSNG